MKLKMLLTGYAVLAAAFGAALLVVPSGFASLVGVPQLNVLETLLLQLIGALDIGLGVMCWTARTAEASKARDALILGLTVVNGLAAVVFGLTAVAVGGNLILWASAALDALFAVLFIVTLRQGMSAPTAGPNL